MSKTTNAYADEKEKLEQEEQAQMELTLKITELLDMYSYDIDAVLVDGMPEIKLVKRQ